MQRPAFVRCRSHHHEVEFAISCAQSFKFKCDAPKFCARRTRHWCREPEVDVNREKRTWTVRKKADNSVKEKHIVIKLTWSQECGCWGWGNHYLSFLLHSGCNHLPPPSLKDRPNTHYSNILRNIYTFIYNTDWFSACQSALKCNKYQMI